MKTEDLKAMGLTDEQISKVMAENGKDVNAAKADAENLKSEVASLKSQLSSLEDGVAQRDKQLEALKKIDAEGLKAEIEKLQNENKATQEKYESDMKQVRIDSAVEKALIVSKAKNIKAVKALLDLEKAELDGDIIKGLDEQLKKLKQSEDSKFLFDDQSSSKQQFKGFKPGDAGDKKPGTLTKEQFNKMGYKERIELYNSDKNLYDSLTNQE